MADTHPEAAGVRRTVVIDDALLREAQRALGTRSIRATIERSLAEAVRRRRLHALADALGSFPMAMTREELLEQRRREARDERPVERAAPRRRGR